MHSNVRKSLRQGVVIPAHPLALDARRKLDERRQRGLSRYYLAAGAGGLAVGVHSTQFAIREAEHGLFEPVLSLAIETMKDHERRTGDALVKVAGVVGPTRQAVREAQIAVDHGYDLVLLSLAALRDRSDEQLIEHCRQVAGIIPLFGFYLQPAVGGRVLSVEFWRRFAQIENVAAIKIAPFNRYQTLDVVRAVAEAGRALDSDGGIALYSGNDDAIVEDLIGQWDIQVQGATVTQRIVGGLLGHWGVWTQKAVHTLARCHEAAASNSVPRELLSVANWVTDMNAAVFDPAHDFRGCLPGILEVLRRQGLVGGTWCLDPHETLSPGQSDEIKRVCVSYPELVDDDFVAKHRDEWLR